MNALSMIIAAALMASPAPVQWKAPTAGIPRLPNGKPNLAAPVPKTAEGRIDITGLWKPMGGHIGDIARDIKNENVPYQPWAKALYDERRANNSQFDPTA